VGTGSALCGMTDAPPGLPGAIGGDTLALRLALGFLGVALAALAILAGLTAIFAARDVSGVVQQQRTQLTAAIAAEAGAGWEQAGSWEDADLQPALDLAAQVGAEARVLGPAGGLIASSPNYPQRAGQPMFSTAIVVDQQHVGRVVVRFSGARLGSADHALVVALLRALAAAAGLAALVALVTGLAIARRLASPVARIISTARSMGSGQRDARVGEVKAPTEIRELASAFDQMADRLDRNEQLRRDLVASVAHELRTPVAVLQAGHEALLDGLAEPTPDELASLHDEVLRLGRMIEDLQRLSAADAAALQLALERCDLSEIAASAADSLASRFDAAGTRLERALEPVEVYADARWMHQLVTNLLTNALKFSPEGGRVIIEVRPTAEEAMLVVADFGVGIPAEDIPHIFDRFWRGSSAARTPGSGIGLAIAAELANAHEGKLTASSQEGHGTRMTLILPRA
jgi:two-component system, OmpR family, sensor histidine kinase BaeS